MNTGRREFLTGATAVVAIAATGLPVIAAPSPSITINYAPGPLTITLPPGWRDTGKCFVMQNFSGHSVLLVEDGRPLGRDEYREIGR